MGKNAHGYKSATGIQFYADEGRVAAWFMDDTDKEVIAHAVDQAGYDEETGEPLRIVDEDGYYWARGINKAGELTYYKYTVKQLPSPSIPPPRKEQKREPTRVSRLSTEYDEETDWNTYYDKWASSGYASKYAKAQHTHEEHVAYIEKARKMLGSEDATWLAGREVSATDVKLPKGARIYNVRIMKSGFLVSWSLKGKQGAVVVADWQAVKRMTGE